MKTTVFGEKETLAWAAPLLSADTCSLDPVGGMVLMNKCCLRLRTLAATFDMELLRRGHGREMTHQADKTLRFVRVFEVSRAAAE